MRGFGRGPLTGIGLLMIGGGMAAVAMLLDNPHFLVFAVPLMMIGAGDGVALTVASDTILTVAPKDRAGAASAVSETGYELGTALGIALLGSVLTAVYQARLQLPPDLDAAVTTAAVESPGGAYEAAPKLPAPVATALTEAAHEAFSTAMTLTTLVGAAILVVGAFVAWYLLPGKVDPVDELAPER